MEIDRIRTEALRYMGYRGQDLPEELKEEIETVLQEACQVARPRKTAARFALERLPEGIRLSGTSLVLTGKDIKRHLEGARECIALALTLGTEAERRILYYEKTDLARAVLLDASCSALVEAELDDYEAQIVGQAEAEGLATNWRFSPGYGDLPLELQRPLAEVLQLTKRIGVTVSENCLMFPRKSVTAFIGLFDPAEKVSGRRITCAECVLKGDCEFRRWGRTCWERTGKSNEKD